MTAPRTAAFVGAAGGVGATRLAVETGALLAAADADVLVLDAAYDTQGLSLYADGRIDPDATALVTDPDVALADAVHPLETPGGGALDCCPAHAPFVRVADAKSADAGERLGERVREAADAYDYVLVDTPPVAANPAVGAVTAADRVAVVTVPGDRGADALSRERGRLADVGSAADAVVANRAASDALGDADVAVPEADLGEAADAPTVEPTDPDTYTRAVASLVGVVFDVELEVDPPRGFLADLRRRLP